VAVGKGAQGPGPHEECPNCQRLSAEVQRLSKELQEVKAQLEGMKVCVWR
jgi:hypothetical protein